MALKPRQKALAKRIRKSWQKQIRMSAHKFTQVAKCRTFHAYTDELWSTCVDLLWVAKRWKTCVDLRTNLSSTKVHASGWPNETQVERKLKAWVDLHRIASPFGQGFSLAEL